MNEKKPHSLSVHQGGDNCAPYPVSRMAPAFDIVDLAREISQADTMLNTHTSAKLKVIADQIRHLQKEAKAILADTHRDQMLHQADFQFKRQPGKTYHLYKKPGGRLYFSMLSPLDWKNTPPHEYMGSYRLENDMSWSDMSQQTPADDSIELVKKLMNSLE